MEVLELQGSGVFSVIPYYFLRHCTTFFPQAFHAFVIRPSYSFRNLVHLFAKMDLWDAPLHRDRGFVQPGINFHLIKAPCSEWTRCAQGENKRIFLPHFQLIHLLISDPIFLALSHGKRIYYYPISHPFSSSVSAFPWTVSLQRMAFPHAYPQTMGTIKK